MSQILDREWYWITGHIICFLEDNMMHTAIQCIFDGVECGHDRPPVQVKVAWTGSLDNYRDLCELYSGCDRLMSQNDPAQLVLTLYLQGYKDLYNDNSSQPQTWLAAAEVHVNACTTTLHRYVMQRAETS